MGTGNGMKESFVLFHDDYYKDLSKLDGSILKEINKKIKNIRKDTFRNKGHTLHTDLQGFRSENILDRYYKIIFSYCEECRKIGRNADFIGQCDFCDQMGENSIIFWRILKHRSGDRDVYKIASKALANMFPPNRSEEEIRKTTPEEELKT